MKTLEHGHPDVPAEMDALTGALEDRGDERGGGRLAVGAGDPADARAAALEDQVHLAAHRDTMGTGDLQLGRIPGHAGARTHHQRLRGDVVGVAAEAHLNARRQDRGALPDRERVGAVDDHDVVAFASERHRAGETAPPRTDHHHGFVRHDAEPATRAKSTVIAVPTAAAPAKAATSRCSRSPSSSK